MALAHCACVCADGFQQYNLGPAGCSFEIEAKKNGYVYQGGDFHSSLKVDGGPKDIGLDFDFKCMPQNEDANYCRDIWWQSLLPGDASSLKILNVFYYENVHPVYPSIFYAANRIAVAEPRARLLYFCLDGGDKSVEGSVYVGAEKNYRVQAALETLKTIKIL